MANRFMLTVCILALFVTNNKALTRAQNASVDGLSLANPPVANVGQPTGLDPAKGGPADQTIVPSALPNIQPANTPLNSDIPASNLLSTSTSQANLPQLVAASNSDSNVKSVDKDTIIPTLADTVASSSVTKQQVIKSNHVPSKPEPSGSQKFSLYMKPICDSILKLNVQHLTRIQQQFTNFAHISGPKLSNCFVKEYQFDPAAKTIGLQQLTKICATTMLPFENCVQTSSAWTPELDKDITTILQIRKLGASHHKHVVADPSLDAIHHDSDDVALVNKIVDQVLKGDEKFMSNPAVKTIDVSDKHVSRFGDAGISPPTDKPRSTGKPSIIVWFNNTETGSDSDDNMASLREMLASKTKSKTEGSTTTSPATSIVLKSPDETARPLTTSIPVQSFTTTTPPLLMTLLDNRTSSTAKPTGPTTTSKPITPKKPNENGKIANNHKESVNISTLTGPGSTSKKPNFKDETLVNLEKKHQDERDDLAKRQKNEKDQLIANLNKKSNQQSAVQDAIKSLHQQSKQAIDHEAKSKIHKQEHQRQMQIDPIKHMEKHREYTLKHKEKEFSMDISSISK